MQDEEEDQSLFVWDGRGRRTFQTTDTNLADLLIALITTSATQAWSNKARTGNLKQFAEARQLSDGKQAAHIRGDLQERLPPSAKNLKHCGSMKKKSARIKELRTDTGGRELPAAKTCPYELNNIKFKKQRRNLKHPTMRSYGCFMPPAVF